jgi:MFS family permease
VHAESLVEWKRGWKTVIGATIGMAVMSGVSSITGVVMAPITHEYGWPRATVAASVFICALLGLLLAPFAGWIIRKIGVRRYAIASILAAIPALILISFSPKSLFVWYGAWLVYGVISVGIGPMVWSTALAGLFDRMRGVALAIGLSGGGLGYFIFPPLAVWTQSHFGWRGVFWMLSAMFLLVLLPSTLLWFHGSEYGRKSQAGRSERIAALSGFSLGEALRKRQFWQLAILAFLSALVEGAMMIHLYPILSEGGLQAATAAAVASSMGVALIVGRLTTGAMLDRWPPHHVFAASIGLVLISCLLAHSFSGHIAQAVGIALLLGLGAGGTSNALAYLTSRYFGLASYSSIFGLLMGTFGVAFGIAPVLAGMMRETMPSYGPMFAILAIASTIAAFLALTLGRPPVMVRTASEVSEANFFRHAERLQKNPS